MTNAELRAALLEMIKETYSADNPSGYNYLVDGTLLDALLDYLEEDQ